MSCVAKVIALMPVTIALLRSGPRPSRPPLVLVAGGRDAPDPLREAPGGRCLVLHRTKAPRPPGISRPPKHPSPTGPPRRLEEQGAETLRCPVVAIADAPGAATVRAWIERAIAAPFDDLVLMTGEGLRRLCGAAARAGIEAAFREALSRMRTITRGPKPAQALREIGLSPGLRAATPTTDGVIAALQDENLAGRRIGVQLPPDSPSRLVDFLREGGALPDPTEPYVYRPAADPREIAGLIEAMSRGEVDAIAFTSAPQV